MKQAIAISVALVTCLTLASSGLVFAQYGTTDKIDHKKAVVHKHNNAGMSKGQKAAMGHHHSKNKDGRGYFGKKDGRDGLGVRN